MNFASLRVCALTAWCLVLAAGTARGQQTFQSVAGTVQEERALDVIQTRDGGYATVGYRVNQNQQKHIYVCRFDALGNFKWDQQISGTGSDVGYVMRETIDGGLVIAAETSSVSATLGLSMLKLDTGGNLLWAWVYVGSAFTGGRCGSSLVELPDASLVLVGRNQIVGSPLMQGVVYHTTAGGVPFAQRFFGDVTSPNAGQISFNDVRESPDGSLIIAGYEAVASTAFRDALLVHLDPGLGVLWSMAYGQTGFSEDADSVEAFDDGTFGLTAWDPSFSLGGTHLIRTNPAGAQIASVGIGQYQSAHASLHMNLRHDVVTAGNALFASGGATKASMMAFPGLVSGAITSWAMVYGGTAIETGEASWPTSDCGFVLGGSSNSFSGSFDVYAVKTNDIGASGCNESVFRPPTFAKFWPERPLPLSKTTQGDWVPWQPTTRRLAQGVVLCEFPWCKADYNHDGFVDIYDFSDFVSDFEAGLISTDFNCDGFVDIYDYTAFVTIFESGC